ncbi:MAG: hypothetical protein IT245_03150 [Bacteroidia bacterium]|nr:hypothetical protein [Bacteroidia bacterium]
MSLKKWIITLLSIVILFIAGIGTWLYIKFQSKSALITYIPAESDVVVYINFKQLIRQSSLKTQSHKFDFLKDKLNEIPYLPKLDELKNAGIDPFGDAAFFIIDEQVYIAFLLNDQEKFKQQIIEKHLNAYQQNSTKNDWNDYSSNDGIINWQWNKQVVYLSIKLKNNNLKKRQFNLLDTKKSFAQSSSFKKSTNDSVPLWFYSKLNPFESQGELKGVLSYQNNWRILLSDINGTLPSNLNSIEALDNYNAVFLSSSNSTKINQFISFIHAFYISDVSDKDEQNISNISNRNLVLFNGPQINTIKYERYEFDENFEKKLVTTFKSDTVNGFIQLTQDSSGSIHYRSNYLLKDSSSIRMPEQALDYYIYFDNTFISKIYNSPIPFKVKLIGKRNGDSRQYIVDFKL